MTAAATTTGAPERDGPGDRDAIVTYECGHGARHAVPSADVRVLRVGDGGFVVACTCGPEALDEVSSEPHESTDHFANIYAEAPSPEEWLRLEAVADGWYDVNPWEPPAAEGVIGTHASRRERFRRKVEAHVDAANSFDAARSDSENEAAKRVPCPQCGADVGASCERPSGWDTPEAHADRKVAARREGLLDGDGDGDGHTGGDCGTVGDAGAAEPADDARGEQAALWRWSE